jgi:hypothetical protein
MQPPSFIAKHASCQTRPRGRTTRERACAAQCRSFGRSEVGNFYTLHEPFFAMCVTPRNE